MKKFIKKTALMISAQTLLATVFASTIFAENKLENSKLVKGTMDMLNDISRTLTIAIPIVCSVIFLISLIKAKIASTSQDEHEQLKCKKMATGAVITLIIGTSASAIFALVTSYYK
ncbi:MAG: hypothetical protein RSA79_00100 [Oscillospiraceae bacterium]